MIVSNCPRCAEVFRVPDAEMPDDAYAECPWCKETFPIAEVLHRLPPVLNIISADGQSLDFTQQRSVLAGGLAAQAGQQDAQAGEGAGLDQSEYYDGGIGTLGDDQSDDLSNKTVSEETVAETWTDVRTGADDSSLADFDVEDPDDTWEEGGQTSNVSAVAPMKVTPAPVQARKSRGSGARTWISIVLGGLAAGPLAVAILWVLTLFGVDVDLGFWPLNGHSAVVNTDRVAAAPVTLTDGVASGVDTEDPDSTSAVDTVENIDSAKLASEPSGTPVDDNAIQIGDTGDDPIDRSAKLDRAPAITMPPIGAGENEISPDALPSDVVDTKGVVPTNNDVPAIVTPDLSVTPAADLAAEKPKRASSTPTSDVVKPAAGIAEPTAKLQPKRADRPEVAETVKRDEIASGATIDSPQPALKTKPAAKPKPKVDAEPDELVKATDAARDMLDQLSKTDRSDLAKTKLLLRDAYIAIAKVGAVARTDSESVRTLLRNVTSSPDLDVWSQNTTAWLGLGNRRPTEGVCLVGTPLSDAAGQRIAISDDNVVSLTDDSVELPKSASVLGLGRIVGADSERTISLVAVESLP
jgi:hypothetical protein